MYLFIHLRGIKEFENFAPSTQIVSMCWCYWVAGQLCTCKCIHLLLGTIYWHALYHFISIFT